MKLAISNLAWDVSEDNNVLKLLNKYNIKAIDIVPAKYFPDLTKAKQTDIEKVKLWWSERGIEITGMQALMFGTVDLNVFGDSKVQNSMLEHLTVICRVGSGLGATRLVFGSPKSRNYTGLSDEQALSKAVTFFRLLGDIALKQRVVICLEPNPTCYGSNFMTTSKETEKVVRSIAHPAIRMQLDIGALTINNESIEKVLSDCSDLIGHVHLSEPNLVTLGDLDTAHEFIHKVMAKLIPNQLASIEMLATKEESQLVSIERALSCAVKYYRPTQDTSI